MTVWRARVAAPLAAIALAVAGCSIGDSPDGVAKKLIEGDLAKQLGLGTITATCEKPPNRDVGTTFTCTSPTRFGDITWKAEMKDAKTVNVTSSNLITPDDLPKFEQAAVTVLENQVGQTLGVENFDCGKDPVVLKADNTFVCALTDPEEPTKVYDATITVTDLATGQFNVKVANTPRA